MAAADVPGAVVAEVARRADVCTSLVYKCRREARSPAIETGFASVAVGQPVSMPAPAVGLDAGVILVELKNARIRIGANAQSAMIAATLKALRS